MRAEREDSNRAASDDAPPVLPDQFSLMRTSAFIKNLLDPFRKHLEKRWQLKDNIEIEEDHEALRNAYRNEYPFNSEADKHTMNISFNASWKSCSGRFKRL